ncbi:MAG: Unknown protein [uncultured Campylobacterales bacterium]|uniref:MipA/OmpV family protein n=1 Tax=uncultured Campylobacterales bacterium TaxID=352960 RepID=A0A6S6T0A2_9BACT|nr:MAG: Unknown protein [uncultured Campylobacterales bacterium]
MTTNFILASSNTAGLGIVHSTSIYKNISNRTMIIPILNYSYKNFTIKGINVAYQLNDSFYILATPRFSDYKKDTIELGLELNKKLGKYNLKSNVLFDILDKHNGFVSQVSLSRTYIKIPFIITPLAGLEYQSENFTNYYYEINDSLLNPFIGLYSILKINKNLSLNMILKNSFLNDNILKSNVVDKKTKQTLILGFTYKW